MNHARQNIEKQRLLGTKGMILFIVLMNMFIPLSTDLYLPALPTMSDYFQVGAAVVNMSLVSFFFFYAVGTLFWGPMSDKYGRKPILLAGSVLYSIASVGCATAISAYILIGFRVLQGFSAGSITAVSMAMIKDCFEGKTRESILATVQTMSGIAPMIAPVIGAILIQYTGWRGSFWLLAIVGAICVALTMAYQETLIPEEKYTGTIIGSLGRLGVVAKNIGFLIPCLVFSINAVAFMGYIAISSYIYINHFGLTSQMYSYFFAANALVSMFGPLIYVKCFSSMNKIVFSVGSLSGFLISGVFVLLLGSVSPWLFWIGFAPFSLMNALLRPFSTGLMFDQQEGDTGSASSLISGVFTVLGSIGMTLASLPWSNIVVGLGVLMTATGAIALALWIWLLKSNIPCKGIK